MATTKRTDDDLEQLCAALKLKHIGQVLERELARAESKGSTVREVLARLFREEYLHRREQSMKYRIDKARLPERWTLESFPFDRQPGVNRTHIRQLAELDFVARSANLVFVGETGVGKTGLACAILMKALGKRLPRAFRQGAGPLRRDVRRARRPLLAQAHRPPGAHRRLTD